MIVVKQKNKGFKKKFFSESKLDSTDHFRPT
jgi:hypothetical protein